MCSFIYCKIFGSCFSLNNEFDRGFYVHAKFYQLKENLLVKLARFKSLSCCMYW